MNFKQIVFIIGDFFTFVFEVLTSFPRSRYYFWRDLGIQFKVLGYDVLLLIFLTAIFAGVVFSIQGYLTFARFGSEASLGEYLPVSLYRELGPIMTAMVFTGRSGSFVAAEIATMKTNGQIECMEIMGINSLSKIILPRFLALMISLPFLVLIFNAFAIFASYLMAKFVFHFSTAGYFINLKYVIEAKFELLMTLAKGLGFGFMLACATTYTAFRIKKSPGCVGQASTYAVVTATLFILMVDVLMTTIIAPHV